MQCIPLVIYRIYLLMASGINTKWSVAVISCSLMKCVQRIDFWHPYLKELFLLLTVLSVPEKALSPMYENFLLVMFWNISSISLNIEQNGSIGLWIGIQSCPSVRNILAWFILIIWNSLYFILRCNPLVSFSVGIFRAEI